MFKYTCHGIVRQYTLAGATPACHGIADLANYSMLGHCSMSYCSRHGNLKHDWINVECIGIESW